MSLKYRHTETRVAYREAPTKIYVLSLLAAVLCATASSSKAENQLRLDDINAHSVVFTFNSKEASPIPKRNYNMPRFFNADELSLQTQMAMEDDPHLQFNYLWMRQNQDHYRYSDGGAAIGRLFRMGVKTWYKSYRDSNKNSSLPNENGGGSISRDVDYRLRLSSDKVKVAFEYEF